MEQIVTKASSCVQEIGSITKNVHPCQSVPPPRLTDATCLELDCLILRATVGKVPRQKKAHDGLHDEARMKAREDFLMRIFLF